MSMASSSDCGSTTSQITSKSKTMIENRANCYETDSSLTHLNREVKSVKDEPTLSVKSNPPTISASQPASSKSGSAPTTWDLVAELKSRLDLIAEFESGLKLEEIEGKPVVAPKKEVPKEEPDDSSRSLKSIASGAGRGTPSMSKSSTTNSLPLNKVKTENEVKYVKDEPTSFTKSNPSTKSASPPASSKSGFAWPSGPVTEHVVLLQTKQVTIRDLEAKFKSRLKLKEIEDDISSVLAPKKEASKEEPVDNSSPLKSTASEAGSGTPSTFKFSVGKRRRNGEESKSNRPAKKASPLASSKSGSAPPSGPVTEDEIRALLRGNPMTVRDFGLIFYPRVKTKRARDAFGAILRRITRKEMNGDSFLENLLFLREESC